MGKLITLQCTGVNNIFQQGISRLTIRFSDEQLSKINYKIEEKEILSIMTENQLKLISKLFGETTFNLKMRKIEVLIEQNKIEEESLTKKLKRGHQKEKNKEQLNLVLDEKKYLESEREKIIEKYGNEEIDNWKIISILDE